VSLRLPACALIGLLALAACSPSSPESAPTAAPTNTAAPTGTAAPTDAGTASSSATSASPSPQETTTTSPTTPVPSISEPTTTNTLPPPPRPSAPAPSTAGKLSASSLPVPTGWRTVVRPGGSEQGYEGNGTWVHARDPRYAAQDVVTLGCADVTRDDYPDPSAALEGTYEKKKNEPGIGLVLQFSTEKKAIAFYDVYLEQLRACRQPGGLVRTTILASSLGLIDHRTSSDGDWTEVGTRVDTRVTLIILTDPGHHITRAQSESLLRQVRAG
jgi:hypothetical protein